ncbi:conserved hypothetical protein [Neospora caninum Liverpool]|uniref:Uncharacterized protein n=1 Tax=Neospora caninum (strain Liverpool) TaxID=572307 RepID=F0VNH6_NEOCL|nr:conserved hypothetical protein [Neospora caninum Liverpool]CBZ55272.1 conserved hypothetical protein [Neospora caninum Liverpool]CEL70002.1 TPA: hypothetical protein BN1204_056960 [Neospora caninum Liverpool]|eukprot:XP_003885300.1 conserved hypothetical protein [Neospora caninum Liverpool]
MFAVSVGVEEPVGRGSHRAASPPSSPSRSSRTGLSDSAKARAPEGHYAPGKGPTQALRVACEKGRRRRLIKWACIVSYVSIFMSILFGVAAMICGVMGDVILSLVALAFETWIDMLSSVAVIWRFQEDEALTNGPSTLLHPPPPYRTSGSTVASLKREDSSASTASPGFKDDEGPKRAGSVTSLAASTSPKRSPSTPLASSSPRSSASVPSSPGRLCGAPSPYECVKPELSVEKEQQAKQDGQSAASQEDAWNSLAVKMRTEPPSPSRLRPGYASQAALAATASLEMSPNSQTALPFAASLPPLNRGMSHAARERQSSMAVGALFIALAVWVSIHSICDLVSTGKRGTAPEGGPSNGELSQETTKEYRSALLTCILCWPSALVFGALALVKFDLAARLRSQVLGRDAMCSAFGVALSLVAGIVSFIALGRVTPGLHGGANAASHDVTSYDAIAALVIGGMMLVEGLRTVAANWKPTQQELLSSNQILVVASPSAYAES